MSPSAGSAGSGSSNESVQVVVRCRPLDEREIKAESRNVVKVYPSRGVIEIENPRARSEHEVSKLFTYDAVYDWSASQQQIYDETVRPLVASVLDGYNGCVFAYGQTGTGKTYTMEGDDCEVGRGIIPRAFDQIWAHIERTTGVEFLVTVRYLEIYMEEIRDLLRHNKANVQGNNQQASKRPELHGCSVRHLHSQTCRSSGDMIRAMRLGHRNRTTGATDMNEHSSRSHAIFQIAVEMAETGGGAVKVGKLNLVDLAGSERQSKTGATGDRLREATKINKALSSLGNVIYALAERSAHVPYRDSKLTRLLQDSLGGNSKTIMIANVGPACTNYEETAITLRYAYRAKSIKNQPIRNEDIKDARLLELQAEIVRLRQLISERSAGRQSFSQPQNGVDEADESDDDDDDLQDEDVEEERGEKEKKIEASKMEIDELARKLRTLEKQMVHGGGGAGNGKSIVDSVNENELRLERQRQEIAERRKREVEMQQRIELEEETCTELRQVFASLQQQVEYKRERLRRLLSKLQSVRQEIRDNREDYLANRGELEEANDELGRQLRRHFMIIDGFVPPEERARLLRLATFDDDHDCWVLRHEPILLPCEERPLARAYRRPYSERALGSANPRYRRESVLELRLDMPLRTTQEYHAPAICPQIRATVAEVLRRESERSTLIVKGGTHQRLPLASRLEQEGRYRQATKNTVEVAGLRARTR